MSWKRRFEAMIDELAHTPGITVEEATLGPPTDPAELAAAKAVAGAAWPEGMTEFYSEISRVDLEYRIDGVEAGSIHIPSVSDVWDHEGHEDELWFDWLVAENPDHPFTKMRPIDRFVPEAYAVLYPVPAVAQGGATVHYHYCGEELVPTDLNYREWLEFLLRSRGAQYGLRLLLGASDAESIASVARHFPDFDPASLIPRVAKKNIPL